jgi:hypothetical protein
VSGVAKVGGLSVRGWLLLGLVTVIVLAAAGVWNPWPGVWDRINRSAPISEPDVVWQQRVDGTPKSVTIAGETVIVEQRTRVEARSLATGVQLWVRKADWSAVAGGDRDAVVAVGRLLTKGYEVLDPTTGAVRRRDGDAVGVWTYRNMLLDVSCVAATDCTLRAWDPRGSVPRWTAFLPGVSTGLFADNPGLLGTRRLTAARIDAQVAGPERVPPLLGFPVDGRVHVVDTATGRVLQDVEPARDERLVAVGGRMLRVHATAQDGMCLFSVTAHDPGNGRQVWRRTGFNLRTADGAGCAQREAPQGARNVLVGVGADGREAVLDGYDGRLLQVNDEGQRLIAVDDRYALVRSADRRSVLVRELGADRTRWTRPAGAKSGGALTPYAVVLTDEKPNRLIALDPRTGRELVVLRTSANALAVGPAGMVIGEGREIGYARFAAAAAAPAQPSGGDSDAPGDPGRTGGASGAEGATCGPKRELCPGRAGG